MKTTRDNWTNYQTAAVYNWLRTEPARLDYWMQQTARLQTEAPTHPMVRERLWTALEARKYNLADELNLEISHAVPVAQATLCHDLFLHSLSQVNWVELAESLLSGTN